MTRIETALAFVLACAFAFVLAIILNGCDLDRSLPDDETMFMPRAAECGCYASLVQDEDGGVCELPGATCPRTCTCVQSTMRLCYAPPRSAADFTGYVCAADAMEGDGGT